MSMMPEIKQGAFPRHLAAILSWRRRHVDQQSGQAGRHVARTWSSRSKCLVLSGALTLGTLAGLTVAGPAYAGSPEIYATGGQSEISVTGSGFTPGTTIRLEALTPGLSVLRTIYVTADGSGEISGRGVYINSLSPYAGDVYVAADGDPGPTAWAQTYVYPVPTIQAISFGCPDPGGVGVTGQNFQPGATVRLELIAANSSWELGSVEDTEIVTASNSGSIQDVLDVSVTPYRGHAFVAVDEDASGGTTLWASLGSVC